MTDQPCSCLICSAAPPARDASIVETVEQHGWVVLRIPGTFDFAYTVGLWHSFRLPEIAMFGLDGQSMQHWLNDCVARVRADEPADEQPFTGVIEGFETQLRPIDESWRDAFFGTAYRFYRGWPVPVRQLVWPDSAGRWPWAGDATVSSKHRQPFAWLPVSEHPPGSWRVLGVFGDDFPMATEADGWALTTREVLSGERQPAQVIFDEDGYDVLDERGHDAPGLCLAYLGELVLRHPGLRELGDLPDRSVAVAQPGGTWARAPLSPELRAASNKAWHSKPDPAV